MKLNCILFLFIFFSVKSYSQNIIEDNQIYRNDFVNLVFTKSINNKLYTITENKSSANSVSNEFRLFVQDTMYNILHEFLFTFPIEKLDVDSTGNVYVLGSFKGTVDVDPSSGTSFLTSPNMNVLNTVNSSGVVLKLGANGSLLWSKAFHFDVSLQNWSYGFFRPGGICLSNNILFVYAHALGHILVDTTTYLNTNFVLTMDVSNGSVGNSVPVSNGLLPQTSFEIDRNYGLVPFNGGVLVIGKRYFTNAFEDAILLSHFNSNLNLVQSRMWVANNQNSNVEVVGVDSDGSSVFIAGRYTGQLSVSGAIKNSSVPNANGVKGFQSFLTCLDSNLNLQWFNNVMNIPTKVSNPIIINDRLVIHVGLEATHDSKIYYYTKVGLLKFEQWVLTPGGTLSTSANNSFTFPNTRGSHGINVNWIYSIGHNIGLSNSSRPGQNVDYGNCSQVLYPQVPPVGKSLIFQVSYELYHNRGWKLVPTDDSICSNELATINILNNFGHCGEIYEWSNFPNFGVILHTGNVLSNVISFGNTYYVRVSSYTSSTFPQGSYTRFYNSVDPSFDTTHVYRQPLPSQILTSAIAVDTILVYLTPPVDFPIDWIFNGIGISSNNDSVYWYNPVGQSTPIEYTYFFEDCTVSSSINYVGTANFSSDISVYPNPSNGKLNLIGLSNFNTLTLLDVNGNQIETYELEGELKAIDLSNYSSGLYFLRLSNDMKLEAEIHRIIIKK